MNNLTILITSCSAYSDMWTNNISLLKQNWDDDSKIYLSSDDYGSYNVKSIHELIIIKGEMSKRIIEALKMISTKYVLICFDDNYLISKVNVDLIKRLISFMDDNSISYCGTAFNIKKGKNKKYDCLKFCELDLKEPYEINFYPSIWNKDDLLNCLREDENIWVSEVMLTKRLAILQKKAIVLRNKNVFPFIDVVTKGKYFRKAYKFIRKRKLFMSNRRVRTIKDEIILKLRRFISFHSPKCLKKVIQNKYRKAGNIIYSDYFYKE